MMAGGLGLVLNRGWAMQILDDFERSPALAYLGGAIITMGGLALVLTHNIWSGWPEIMVTLFGWGAAIEGLILLVFPKALFGFARMLVLNGKIIPIFGVLTMILGVALLWL